MMRVMFVDIETTNLSASFGYVLCASYKYLDEKKVHTISIADFPPYKKDPTNDRFVVQALAEKIKDADIIVTHYGRKFDIPFINTRLLYHGLPSIPPKLNHVDTWAVARFHLKMHSNRLAALTDFFGLSSKTPVDGAKWIKAMAGCPKALKYVVRHCEADIRALEDTYLKLRPVMPCHPSVSFKVVEDAPVAKADIPACQVCGSKNQQRRGSFILETGYRARFQCKSCGKWNKSFKIYKEKRAP